MYGRVPATVSGSQLAFTIVSSPISDVHLFGKCLSLLFENVFLFKMQCGLTVPALFLWLIDLPSPSPGYTGDISDTPCDADHGHRFF